MDSGPFFYLRSRAKTAKTQETKTQETKKRKRQKGNENREKRKGEVRTMTVLFSELLVPGWAEGESAKLGLDSITATYSDQRAITLPCHNADPELFFSEKNEEIALAKSLCGACPVRRECLAGAVSREEPCGVWGGELFEDGQVIAKKRTPGRPRLVELASATA
jgi:WhiB family redox-sensing transcriptional regulator